MKENQIFCELDDEGRRCYAIRILKYEMSRYHIRKLDFHHLFRDVLNGEFVENSQEFLLASTDSYNKFEGTDAEELFIEKLIISGEITECENEIINYNSETVKLLFFQIYDWSTWEIAELELPDKYQTENLRFSCKWSFMHPLKWLESIDVISNSTNEVVHNFSFITESYRAIAYDADIYCAVFDEHNNLEIGILNSNDHDIKKELYNIKR